MDTWVWGWWPLRPASASEAEAAEGRGAGCPQVSHAAFRPVEQRRVPAARARQTPSLCRWGWGAKVTAFSL